MDSLKEREARSFSVQKKLIKIESSKFNKKISYKNFCEIIGFKFNKDHEIKIKAKLKKNNFNYRYLNAFELDFFLFNFFNLLNSNIFTKSGSHKYKTWEMAWTKNYKLFKNNADIKTLTPNFFRKKIPIRLQGKYIYPKSNNFESNFFDLCRYSLFSKFFNNFDNIYEFGCGSSHNLVAINKIFTNKKLIGLDWSKNSIKIINLLKKRKKINIEGFVFDFFKPNSKINIKPNSAVFTVCALEQIGSKYINFINFLRKNKPSLCLHFEPMQELILKNTMSDYLSNLYLEKRNYLKKFLTYLDKLEKNNIIKIIKKQRVGGGQFHEGYSYVIYKFIK